MSSTRSAEMIRSMDSPVFFIRSCPESFFVDALLALAAQREREHAVFLILGKVFREHRARFAEPFLQRGAQLFFERRAPPRGESAVSRSVYGCAVSTTTAAGRENTSFTPICHIFVILSHSVPEIPLSA